MLMKALQVTRPHLFELMEIPVPQLPAEGEDCVLVRTNWASMCGSDIPFFSGNKRYRSYPLVPGAPMHECVGEVVASTSKTFRQGDSVLAIPEEDRGLAEFFLAQTSKTVSLTCKLDDPGAACIIQPLSTVMNAMDRLGDLEGKSLAVMGLGSIGLLFCWLAKRGGASSVVGIDPVAGRCRFAETLGATRTICSRGIETVQKMRTSPK
jgi:L-iditol 2-dehydrogenase